MDSKPEITQVTIRFGDKEFILTLGEARTLYRALDELFGRDKPGQFRPLAYWYLPTSSSSTTYTLTSP